MVDRLLMILEILLLIWIVWQGQIIVACERGVYNLQKERENERRQWREAKRKQFERKNLLAVSNPQIEDGISQKSAT